MDATQNSRKRNRRSSPLIGTFTRSKSQFLLHRNRSGQLRSDPVPRQDEPYSGLLPFRGRQGLSEDAVLVKDLRARRVYSPQSSAGASSDLMGNAFPKESAVDSDCANRKIAGLGFGSSSSVENSDMVVDDVMMSASQSPDLGLSCKARDFDRGNSDSVRQSGELQDHMQFEGNSSDKIDDLVEEIVLTTPPDADICGDSKVNGDEAKREDELRVKDTPLAGNATKNSGEGFPRRDSQRNDSVLKSKSVLRPRLPGKLFKAPGSVSYRRLFPFLMDIMGDDSGTPKLRHCQKDEKGMDGQEFQLPLSSQSQEGSKLELETNSCTMHDTNVSKLTFSRCLPESSMQLDAKVTSECLSAPSVDDKCLSESNADPTADVGSALHNDDFKQYSIHKNNLDYAKATNHSGCISEQFGVPSEECMLTTPDVKSVVNLDQLPMDLTRSTQENAGEEFCLKACKRKDSLLKSKSVPRPGLHRRLFKTPGSVSYKRLLPFLMELTKDDSGTSKFGHQTDPQKDEAPMHDTVECNALQNNILVNPANELSHGNRPKLTSFQDLPELPMQLDAKEVVHECLSVPVVNEHIENVVIGSKDECVSESKFGPCSVMVDFQCAKIVANIAHNDGFKQEQNLMSRQSYSESPPKDQTMLYVNGDVSNLAFENHSSKEKGFTVNCDETKHFVNLEKRTSVSGYPSEGQSLSPLDPNMLDAEENETNSRTINRSNDVVVLNHVNVSNEEPRQPSEKIISEKSDMAGHGDDESGSFLKGIVYGSRTRSKGSNNKNSHAGEMENGSEFKTALVLTRCPRIKLLRHTGSFNYKRLLPTFLNTLKYNSLNVHYPKLQKFLDQAPLLPISDSKLRVNPISDSNGRVPMEHCTGNSGTQQKAGLHACDLSNDSSSSRSQIPEFQSSHDSCNVIQLQDEKVVLNGLCKLESSTAPPISVHRIDLSITPLGPKINEAMSREEGATSVLSGSSVYSSSFSISSNEEKPPEKYGCCQNLSQLKVSEQLTAPAVGSQKGILKRNPRGCRGLCTCLNCVSFRLHAERAFEFSRNQLLDAEEVAQDLMKELSHLRNMLQRSTGSVNDNPVFYESQVKEACRKAFATEQLARDRLSQMNDDLNIHCRIPSLQRPRVRFADHVKEKVIQPGR